MSDSARHVALSAAMERMAPPGIRLGCRLIREGDEALLLPEEASALRARRPAARRASGAARALARHLLKNEGMADAIIGRSATGAPLWPPGVIGSLAHDDEMAVAAIARAADVPSVGIDVEPADPLPDDIAALVFHDGDAVGGVEPMLSGRALFSAKEAVYKAVHPLDGEILGYEHIRVDFARGRAITTTGHGMRLFFCLHPRVVVLAVSTEDQPSSIL
ncbi:UNVERIFIED_ORG: 4'-phosphopantetheinyl transferase EntD [Shinella zoogloeoides]|nr:4'-phosphopantetheinyl transferase EntD [Shinella zoogloeoides]